MWSKSTKGPANFKDVLKENEFGENYFVLEKLSGDSLSWLPLSRALFHSLPPPPPPPEPYLRSGSSSTLGSKEADSWCFGFITIEEHRSLLRFHFCSKCKKEAHHYFQLWLKAVVAHRGMNGRTVKNYDILGFQFPLCALL